MSLTFANLPVDIIQAISTLLSEQTSNKWLSRAAALHTRYMDATKGTYGRYIQDYDDALAYLSLRSPATYAQIYSACSQVAEIIPSWKPQSLLDIGCGPGTGTWSAATLWPTLKTITCIDKDPSFVRIGKHILSQSNLSCNVTWQQSDVKDINTHFMYDIVIIANVLNELSAEDKNELITNAYAQCKGIMILIEPGTFIGTDIIQKATPQLYPEATLLAPYIYNSFVSLKDKWIHFPQRFIRPEFLRRLRQYMRESSLMASDWEESKYAFAAFGKIPAELKPWGRCISPVIIKKGFLETQVLTEDTILPVKVLKRYKKQYTFAKKLRWGQIILDKTDIFP